MDFVIVFFRDVLDGPLYIAVSIICSILICSCIGYMGEKYLAEKKEGEDFASKHATADDKPLTAEEAKKALETATSQTAENGEAVAQYLDKHPKVAWVNYCSLPHNKYHELAKKYLPICFSF